MRRFVLHRPTSRGFTLIEILLAMLFLSLGIMGVIAFFFLGVTDNRRSVRITRGTLIAKTVREALVNAIRYPENLSGINSPAFRFEMLSVCEDNNDLIAFTPQRLNGFYFHIDTDAANMGARNVTALHPFNNAALPMAQRVLDLPFEAFDRNGNLLREEVWRMRDTFLPYNDNSGFDEDDSHFYSFRILIRRAIPRPGEPASTGTPKPGDLFDVTVYVFRQYTRNVITIENYDAQTGEALFTDAGGRVVEELTPIVTYHFLLGGS